MSDEKDVMEGADMGEMTDVPVMEDELMEPLEEGEEVDLVGEQAKRIAELENQIAGMKDEMLRTMAEAQNIRRRIQEQMAMERKFGAESLVRELLPVLDTYLRMEQALEKGASLESIADGMKATDKLLRKALESVGVKQIAAVGEQFNPEVHEALVTHETDEHPDETVLDELETGFTMHERVIRPARVRVSKRS